MSQKSARGTKRTCQSCDSRFYDLNRDPAVCPMCGTEFAYGARDVRASKDVDPEADEQALKASRAAATKEIAREEPTTESEELPAAEAGDELAEISTEEAEIEPVDEEEVFLEEEEEEGGVEDLIDSPIEGEDEEA